MAFKIIVLGLFYIIAFLVWYAINNVFEVITGIFLPYICNGLYSVWDKILNSLICLLNKLLKLIGKGPLKDYNQKKANINSSTITDVVTGIWFIIGFRCIPYIKKLDERLTINAILGFILFVAIAIAIIFLIIYFIFSNWLINRIESIIILHKISDVARTYTCKNNEKEINSILDNDISYHKCWTSKMSTIKASIVKIGDKLNKEIKSEDIRCDINKITKKQINICI